MRNGWNSASSLAGGGVGYAEAAADLRRAVDDAPDGFGDGRLGHRGLLAGTVAAVERPGAAPDQPPACLDVDHRLGDALLNPAQVGEPLAECLALERPL